MAREANVTSFQKGHVPWNKGLEGWRKGYKHTKETKKKISETRKSLGLKPKPYLRKSNVKKKCETCNAFFEVVFSRSESAKFCSNKCRYKALKGQKAWNKGVFNSKTYNGYHYKVRTVRGKPSKCEICKTTNAKKFTWANISGNYEDVFDYKRMCVSCHSKFDGIIKNIG